MNDIRKRIYKIITIGYTGDVPSRLFDAVIAVSILLNLFIIFFETFEASAKYIGILNVIELVTIVIFTVEYILRLMTADFEKPGRKTYAASLVAFIFSLYGLIDLISFLPYWLSFLFPAASIPAGAVAFRMLRVVRILRLFRVNRYYDAFNVITEVLKEKKNQIASALFIILMMVMAASIIMYSLEHTAQPEAFKNAFSGIWWAVSTLLTVGYGDIYPVTPAGRFVGIILAFCGVGIVAVPTGIISAGFVQQYTKIKDLTGTSDEYPVDHLSVDITEGHGWIGQKVKELILPEGVLVFAIIRGHENIIPKKDTVIEEGDRVVIGTGAEADKDIAVEEIMIGARSEWADSTVADLAEGLGVICVMIKRGGEKIIPKGSTLIRSGDAIIVLAGAVGGKR
ncbi:MAG: ion transporter [Lachnospiraceae bacterium]|nr:ion transporter [Lachnospiraceae bacterium]